jgi:predicted Ser/Thr protein kinase
MKFILNKNLTLKTNHEGFYLLYNNDKTYKINESIFEVLCIFETNKLSVEDAYDKYVETKKDSIENTSQLKGIFESFVKQLVEKGFILDYGITDKSDNFIKEDYLSLKNKFPTEIHNSSNSLILSTNHEAKKCVKITKKTNDFNKKENEIFFIKKLSKKNIAPKLYKFEQNYIITEFIHGKNLKKFIEDSSLSNKSKIRLFFQILKLYTILFNMKIHHGDIHFKNIMIRKNSYFKILLIDFENTYFHNEKKDNITKGALNHFIPPELMTENCFNKMNNIINKQGEVYQLTLIFYYILYKGLPFKATTWKELFSEVNYSNFSYELDPKISKSIIFFIRSGLSPNPNLRFKNVQEMYKYFKNYIYEEGI